MTKTIQRCVCVNGGKAFLPGSHSPGCRTKIPPATRTSIPRRPIPNMLLRKPRHGELALALMGVWVRYAREVLPGFGLSWEGNPVLPPVLVLMVKDLV